MLSRRSLKAHMIALALIWLYTIAGIVFSIVIPGDVNRSGSDQPRDVTIGFAQR